MTLTVLSICALSLIIAFGASLSASVDHRSLAVNDVALRSTAETVLLKIQQQSGPGYVSCATPGSLGSYPSSFLGAPTGFTAVVTAISYWNAATASYGSTCTAGSTAPQLITLTVTNNSNGTHVWTQFVVDDRGKGSTSALSVTGVSPSSLGAGAASQTLSITGTGFVSGATASFSDTDISVTSTTFVNSTTLNVLVSVASNAKSATSTISVTNPSNAVATSGSIFTVNGALSVTAVSPTSLHVGDQNQGLVLTGTGFVNGATVSFSNTGVTVNTVTFVSSTTLDANVSVSGSAPTGAGTISVTNPDGANYTSGAIFTVLALKLHVSSMTASIDGASKSSWDAKVTVVVVDASGNAVAGVTVTGSWDTTNTTSTASCTTDSFGSCQVEDGVSLNLGASAKSRTYTVSNLTLTGYVYDASANVVSSATANQP